MRTTVAVLVLLVIGVGTVYTQSLPPPDALRLPPIPEQNPATQPKEPTIDQLLDRIERIRVQKAELEKQEQVAVAEVRKRMGKQTERLNKLGLGATVLPPVVNVTAPDGLPVVSPGVAPAPGTIPPQPRGR